MRAATLRLLLRVGIHVLFGELDGHAGQGQQGDQVRDGHEAVEGVRQVPGVGKAHGRADDDEADKQNLIDPHGLVAEDILAAAGAVEGPAQDRGEGEEAEADGDDDRAELAAEHAAHGSRHVGAVAAGAPGDVDPARG